MRLADHLIGHDWHFPFGEESEAAVAFMEEAAARTGSAPVVVADNVATYVRAKGTSDPYDMPTLAPPWPQFWLEYQSASGQQRRGVLVMDLTDGSDDGYLAHLAEQARSDTEAGGVTPRWIVGFAMFSSYRKAVWGPLSITCIALDAAGRPAGSYGTASPVDSLLNEMYARRPPIDDPLVEGADFAIPDVATIEAMTDDERDELYRMAKERLGDLDRVSRVLHQKVDAHERQVRRIEQARETLQGEVEEWALDKGLLVALAPAFQAIAFLHCKNMVLDEISPPDKVQAKRRRKGKKELLRYHTLRLDVPRRQTEHGAGRAEHNLNALHVVAGHFAHYGACCPDHEPKGLLFGRLSGVYWVPSHVRGDRDSGTVLTDFDLNPVAAGGGGGTP